MTWHPSAILRFWTSTRVLGHQIRIFAVPHLGFSWIALATKSKDSKKHQKFLEAIVTMMSPEERELLGLFNQQNKISRVYEWSLGRLLAKLLTNTLLPAPSGHLRRMRDISILPDPFGKPQLIPKKTNNFPLLEYSISITHCVDQICVGLSNSPIGVDLELIRPRAASWNEMIQNNCQGLKEWGNLHNVGNSSLILAHIAWTLKEASLKSQEINNIGFIQEMVLAFRDPIIYSYLPRRGTMSANVVAFLPKNVLAISSRITNRRHDAVVPSSCSLYYPSQLFPMRSE